MNTETKIEHPKSAAREYAVKFLYQCECEKLYHFSEAHFTHFASYLKLPDDVACHTKILSMGSLQNRKALDEKINEHSRNWRLERMPTTDRLILRIATYEMNEKSAPYKVIINEAIEIAKKFGTKNSGAFVNAILDSYWHELDSSRSSCKAKQKQDQFQSIR
ncbi:MAG: transcription antitermination factor NusB [Oligoflexales bacterium]|nr:transcription antitermination factor NusB [Oligoflexales bacterium]